MDCYHIEWKGTYPLEKAAGRPEARESGVYAMFNADDDDIGKPIYIGKTDKFSQRMNSYLQKFSKEEIKRRVVCLGIIHPLEGKRVSPEQLRQIEGLLIWTFTPATNKAGKKNYTGKNLLIINTGKIGEMNKLVTYHSEILDLIKKNITSSW